MVLFSLLCLVPCFVVPLQEEIAGILGEHKAANTSFIKGFKYEPSWEGYKFVDRLVCVRATAEFVFRFSSFGESKSKGEGKGREGGAGGRAGGGAGLVGCHSPVRSCFGGVLYIRRGS